MGTSFRTFLFFLTLASCGLCSNGNRDEDRWIGRVFAEVFENSHYRTVSIDEISGGIIDSFAEALDPSGFFLTEADLEEFKNTWKGKVETDIRSGAFLLPAEMLHRALQRVNEAEGSVAQNCSDQQEPQEVPLLRHRERRALDQADLMNFWATEARMRQVSQGKPFCSFVFSQIAEARRELSTWSQQQTRDSFLDAVARVFDPQSSYYSSHEHRRTISEISVTPSGLGLELEAKDGGGWSIRKIVPGGPADKTGGIEVGDTVIAVGKGGEASSSTKNISIERISDYTNSEPGDMVTMELVSQQNKGERKTMSVVSERLSVRESEVVGGAIAQLRGWRIGILRVPAFYIAPHEGHEGGVAGTDKDSERKLRSMMKEGIEGLVIDLRGDSGGTVEEAVNLAGLFMDGIVSISRDRSGRLEEHKPAGTPLFRDPVLILVDARTASAAEVFAKGMQTSGRGIVIGGERTYGKSSMQNLLDLNWHGGGDFPDGAGGLKVTTRVFFGADGSVIQGVGVNPDIRIPCPYDIALRIAYGEGLGEIEVEKVSNVMNDSKIHFKERSLETLPELLRRSRKRTNIHPYFSKARELQDAFASLLAEDSVKVDDASYSRVSNLFSSLRALITETKNGQHYSEGLLKPDDFDQDYHLSEALEITADILDLQRPSGREGVPKKSEAAE